ncbi:cellulose binding domain-containing protein [Nonomuraea sp. NPDC050153]|uniref:cellulose binding domain-containing protein n=1 Tax=Nonomuraea sp. NPDC050153 TaxID=3364359 RepID=UPI0037BBC688
MSHGFRRVAQASVALAALLGAGAVIDSPSSTAYAASAATVNGAGVQQPIDGFGISEFFGRSAIMHGSQGLSAQRQREILDLLFNRTGGAGLSMLRLGISSTSSSIQPTDPGGPNATPRYVWDGNDEGQVWLAKEAKAYGVNRFYADAWSAPGYMKTNGDEANGGSLCGLAGASCSGGDWRRAYAAYLVQYAKFYAQEGVTINDLGFTNEPNWTTSYSSMRFTPAQAVEFAKILGPVAGAAGLSMTCCDVVGWSGQRDYTTAIAADSEAHRWVATHTGHSYGSAPTTPLPVSGRRTWMSEWSPDGTTWNENWDDGSGYDGFTVAQAIHTALTGGNVNGYIYWYGASTGATRGFIQMNGDSYRVSKRLWAMAAYSRFIRPGANRIAATTSDGNLRLSAYRNGDGSIVVVALNAAGSATEVSYALQNTGITTGTATPYLTNGSSSMAAQAPIAVGGGAFTATVPARSLATYVLRPGGTVTPPPVTPPPVTPPPVTPPPGAACRVIYTTNAWNTGLTADLAIANTGGSPIGGWSLTFTLPAGQSITSGWNATYSPASGQITARNVSHNATIPAGGSVSAGFQATHTGNTGEPTQFTLNGTACAVT